MPNLEAALITTINMLGNDLKKPFAISSDEPTDNDSPKLKFSNGSLHLPSFLLLVLLIVTRVVIYLDIGALAVRCMQSTIPLFHSQGFDMTQAELGLIGSIFTIGVLISSPLSAHLAKTYHPFTMVTVGQLVWVCSTAAAAVSQDYWGFLAARLLTGLSEGPYLTVIPPCVLELAPGKSKTLWYTVFSCAFPLGIAIGFVYGSYIAVHLGWRAVFIIEAVAMCPLSLCLLLLYRDPRLKVVQQTESLSSTLGFLEALKSLAKNRVYVLMVTSLSFFIFAVSGLGYWMPYIFKNQFSIDPQVTGLISGLVLFIAGSLGALTGSIYQDYKLKPYQLKFEANEITENQICEIRSIVSLNLCRCVAFASGVLFMTGALSDNLLVFLTCFTIGTFIGMLNIGSFGIALMSCVDRSHRNHSIAISLFSSQLLGGFHSTFVVGVLIQYIDIYWAVVVLMLFMGPYFLLMHFAYKAAKHNSLTYTEALIALD
jgi:MFS family permease